MSVREYDYKEIHDTAEQSKPILSYDDITLISDLEVNIDVIVGTTSLTVAELYSLKTGSALKLEQELNTPVDIRVNGNVIARGILSYVNDNYAVEITESINDRRN